MKTTPEQNTTEAAALNWQVFVTPGIPIVTPDRPPGVRETYFQAMASTLIYGIRDAVLVDAFMTIAPVVETFPMSKVNDALEHLRSGKARYRIVLANPI
jgi:D-arabinose 1-dehydrogenase-like Zn-dependent alcohol dehydrogenase